jgi:hypothetical protein
MFRSLRFFALLLMIALPSVMLAASDVVHLTNGDRITGVIQRFGRGLVAISTGSAGRIMEF